MKQYLDLLKSIKENGIQKQAARKGMPGTTSLFGYNFRHDLSEGFPLLTTKKVFWKAVVFELLWFLKGNTNIKYLVDNGINIWNEDAYNYYLKECNRREMVADLIYSFDEFIYHIKLGNQHYINGLSKSYVLGDCGKQYGWLWRNWEAGTNDGLGNFYPLGKNDSGKVDQIKELIDGLKNNPSSRRHILTAWNPATLDDMALNACHAMVQFNCRPFKDIHERSDWADQHGFNTLGNNGQFHGDYLTSIGVPQYKLDCQLYQRSADVVLGVPFNIASYGLLTHILCKMTNMIPGDLIMTYGDVHIYDNHMDAVNEQLTRTPSTLPTLQFENDDPWMGDIDSVLNVIQDFGPEKVFALNNYNPQPAIKAKLSTGLI